jgi:AcrR family transcriptional regulator
VSENDRRVLRTRATLHRALIELMIERGYDRVTVQDILDRANIGRSTFYAHYRGKDDLLVISGAEYLRSAITERTTDPIRTLFDLAEDHPDVYRTLLGRKSTAVVIRGTQQMVADVLADYGMDAPTNTFLSWGLVGVLGAVAEGRITVRAGYAAVQPVLGVRATTGDRTSCEPGSPDAATTPPGWSPTASR